MSDIDRVRSIINASGSKMLHMTYYKKDGSVSSGTFHPKAVNFTKGGVDTTGHIPKYISLWNVNKRRWSKISMEDVIDMSANGKKYKF